MPVEPDPSRRWPLHPQPREYETLCRWVERIAESYGLPPQSFCRPLFGCRCPSGLDTEPLEQALAVLSAGTGVPVAEIWEMRLERVLSSMLNEYVRRLEEADADPSTNSAK
ncbi:MAG: TniQ family protein [Geminicoccaceae bacterium]